MTWATWVAIGMNVALWMTFAWLHGFNRGRRDMRQQIVKSLRFSAALHDQTRGVNEISATKAAAFREAADRIERYRP